MGLTPGTRFGPYEVTTLIGVGGMGEVYRATDTNLKRAVAIKVLPASVATDAERLARFQREAEVLAALNHPNIAAIYGLERSGAATALVMELVEGPTLADRIAQGAVPLDEALPIAKQIAEALEAAHEQGIIHRDLKPANIKVRPDGTVKVLDFGLAKAMEPVGAMAASNSMAPTITTPAMTQAGMILGTAAYMSPEQARGKPVDKRADIWAFGAMLFEMLSGTRPFDGEDIAETLGAVIHKEPVWTRLPATTPAPVRTVVQRCLQKDPKQRLRDTGDARLALEGAFETVAPQTTGTMTSSMPRGLLTRNVVAIAAAVASAILATAVTWSVRPSPTPAPVSRFTFALPQEQSFTIANRQLVATSPDGTQIVYVANTRLYLRPISAFEAQPIPGTEVAQGGVANPVFSPDGKAIAFWSGADQTVKRVAVSGGAALTMCPAERPFGMSWTEDGLVFGQGSNGIVRVSASGGKPERLVDVKENEVAHGPQILPGGQSVLFTLATGTAADRWDKAQIVVQSLPSGERKVLIESGTDARYLPTGHLVYAVGGTMFAVPFDLRRLQVTGAPTPMVEGVMRANAPTGTAQFSVSRSGLLVFVPERTSSPGQVALALFDRQGVAEPLKLPPGAYAAPRVSPDGKRVAFEIDENIGTYDLEGTSTVRRMTFSGHNHFPVWSADGTRIAFQSDRAGDAAIWWQRADGTGTAERLTTPAQGTSHVPDAWSPKGDTLLFSVTQGASMSLWVFSLLDRRVRTFDTVTSTASSPIDAVFSPDGKWIAYRSAPKGGIFVQPFPPSGAKFQAPTSGIQPVWSHDGRELFYVSGSGGQFAVVRVTTQPTFGFSGPVPIERRFSAAGAGVRNYDISGDGRFIGFPFAGTALGAQIQVVVNWLEELKQRVPVK